MSIERVHFTMGDGCGWAIDEDLRLLRHSLKGVCRETSLLTAQAVHAVWWMKLLRYRKADFGEKPVLCYADNAPFHYATDPEFLQARELVTHWIARSQEAVAQFAALGIESHFAPYTIDAEIFRPLPPEHPEILALAERWSIPRDRYLVANFHRDTEGGDLRSPKIQKGPDAFLEIVSELHGEGAPVHVLLAGPRRFFLRERLAERGVPFTFVGQDSGDRDDLALNILPRRTLNLLYQIADLHLITSRWEGGPHSILESAATRCPVLSTPVGIASDVLTPECLFRTVQEACAAIRRDLGERHLRSSTDTHFSRAQTDHSADALRRHLLKIYAETPARNRATPGSRRAILRGVFRREFTRLERFFPRLKKSSSKPLRMVFWQNLASKIDAYPADLDVLKAAMQKRGCEILDDWTAEHIDAVFVFGEPKHEHLQDFRARHPAVPLIRFFPDSLGIAGTSDLTIFDATICPSLEASFALRKAHPDLGRTLVLAPFRPEGATRLAPPADATWNLAVLEDVNLSAVAFCSALNGVLPEKWSTQILPHGRDFSAKLGGADVLLIPPRFSWAAQAIAAAQALRIPVLFPEDSHWQNLVWFAGLPFCNLQDLPLKLDTLRAKYALFQRLTAPAVLAPVVDRLLWLVPALQQILSDENRTRNSH